MKIGDIVRLKGHEVNMTVNRIEDNLALGGRMTVYCLWYDEALLEQYGFDLETLTVVNMKPKIPKLTTV